jgi:hypothetical protein
LPATIELSTLSRSLIALLHSGPASPELLFFMNARNDEELKRAAKTVLPFVQGRKAALEGFLEQNEASEVRVSQKTKKFWEDKRSNAASIAAVLALADKSTGELDKEAKRARAEYFENTKAAWEVGLALVLTKLSTEMLGPYALGE